MVRVTLPEMPDVNGRGEYEVLDPGTLYHGKSYSEWTCDWMNWFLSKDADLRTSGPVVFLRSKGLPNAKTGANISDIPGKMGEGSDGDNSIYSESTDITGLLTNTKGYVNDPNIKVGGDRLRIFDDQVVFVPIIIAYWLKTTPYADWGGMQDYTGLTIDYGDNPPERKQLTINGESVVLPTLTKKSKLEDALKKKNTELEKVATILGKKEQLNQKANTALRKMDKTIIEDTDKELGAVANEFDDSKKIIDEINIEIDGLQDQELMQRFRISTPIFTAIVPEAQYGRSVKDFLEETPIAPNNYPAMVDGYFVMLKFEKGIYWVHSWASAPREARGPYFSEMLYQIEVSERSKPRGNVTNGRPARNERVLSQVLEQKTKDKDLTKRELERFKRYCSIVEDEPNRRAVI